MDILLILILLFIAWLLGHALDSAFNKIEKLIKGNKVDDEIFTAKPIDGMALKSSTSSRLYLVPTAFDSSTRQS